MALDVDNRCLTESQYRCSRRFGLAVFGLYLFAIQGFSLCFRPLAAHKIIDVAHDGYGQTCCQDRDTDRESSSVSRSIVPTEYLRAVDSRDIGARYDPVYLELEKGS